MDVNANTLTPLDLHGPLVDVRNPFGALLLGGTASVGLLGVTTLQVWYYYNNHPGDHASVKTLVSTVWVIEFVRSTFTIHAVYHYLVLNWGNPFALTMSVWSINIIPLTTHLVGALARSFFIWRIWVLSRNQWSAGRLIFIMSIVILAVCNFGLGLATYLFSANATSLAAFADGPQRITSPIAMSIDIATDVVITMSLAFLLNHKRTTGFSRTNRMIKTLIFYTVQAGLINVVAGIAVVAMMHYVSRIGFEYLSVYAIFGNLYANSLLASLNARTSLRYSNAGIVAMTALSQWQSSNTLQYRNTADMTQAGAIDDRPKDAIHVQITQSTIKMVDNDGKDEWSSGSSFPAVDVSTNRDPVEAV